MPENQRVSFDVPKQTLALTRVRHLFNCSDWLLRHPTVCILTRTRWEGLSVVVARVAVFLDVGLVVHTLSVGLRSPRPPCSPLMTHEELPPL